MGSDSDDGWAGGQAVDLGGGGDDGPHAVPGRGLQDDLGPAGVGLDRLDGAGHDEAQADARGQVDDRVVAGHGALHEPGVANVTLEEGEGCVPPGVAEVVQRPGGQVVDDRHLVAPGQQRVAERRADEPGAAGDEDPAHGRTTAARAAGARREARIGLDMRYSRQPAGSGTQSGGLRTRLGRDLGPGPGEDRASGPDHQDQGILPPLGGWPTGTGRLRSACRTAPRTAVA
jgi:hypothetical protein